MNKACRMLARIAGRATLLATAAVVLLTAGMATSAQPATQGASAFADTRWSALQIDDRAIAHRPAPTMQFIGGVKVRGRASCNSFFGSVHISGESMRFLDVGQQLTGCEPEILEEERRFMAALIAVRSYRLESGRLVLFDEKKTQRLLLDQRFDERPSALNPDAPPTRVDSVIASAPPPVPGAYASSAVPAWPAQPRNARLADLEFVTLTPALGEYFSADRGVLVVRAPTDNVFTLQEGDVIVAVNGRQPANGPHALRILGTYAPGNSLHVELIRKHQPIAFDVVLPP